MTYPPDEFDLVDPGGGRRGAHRARSSPAALVAVLVLAALAVAAVAVAGLLAVTPGTEPGAAPTAPADVPPAADPLPTAAPTTAAGAPPAPSTAATSGASGPPGETVAGGDPSVPLGVADRAVPVGVLNATTTGGLAGQVAGELRAAGWTPVVADNYAGDDDPPTSVLYAEEELADTARALAAELGGAVVRLDRQAVGEGLVVVLGEDYSGLR